MLDNYSPSKLWFFVTVIACLIIGSIISFVPVQKTPSITLGAYYFDGWSGLTQGHITKRLVNDFSEREPIWGWKTSTQHIVDSQIKVASNAGISFFSFCWYHPDYNENTFVAHPLNRALQFYMRSHYKSQLKFNLLIANHQGFTIGPKEWPVVSKYWISLFNDKSYVKVNGKPLITFFSLKDLIKSFGSVEQVREALEGLRQNAQRQNLGGVTIAICIYPDRESLSLAQQCGFDVLTGYNYHEIGFKPNQAKIPIDSLLIGSQRIWDGFRYTKIPYIPVATLNWDPRPWATQFNSLGASPRYVGLSATSVYKAILDMRTWLKNNKANATQERIALIYAWNEYGEGAWLTPSKKSGNSLVNGVKKALSY